MFCQRKIDLLHDSQGLPSTLITQEMLRDAVLAEQLLLHAKAQADQVLEQVHAQREQLLEHASLEFWKRANAQLKQWESERQAMCAGLEHYAASFANQALRCVLEDVMPEQQLAALIKQLLLTQLPPVQAVLRCHPLERDSLERCLANHGATPWVLRPDESLKPQALILETPEGDFRIDWNALCAALLADTQVA